MMLTRRNTSPTAEIATAAFGESGNPLACRFHALCDARPRRRRRDGARPRGVIVAELILTFPILFIFLLAIVEFGLIFVTIKHVSFASRFGAKIASEASLAGLEFTNGGAATPDPSAPLFARIQQYLESSGVTGPCQVILEHDVVGVSNPLQDNDPGGCGCAPPGRPLPTPVIDPDPPNNVISTATTVRVTVVVRIIDNVPDLLCFFGFSIAEKTIKETTTYRYEECAALTQPSGG